jgi:hypothetical protein
MRAEMPENRTSRVELKKVIDLDTPTEPSGYFDIIFLTEEGGEHGFTLSMAMAQRLRRVMRFRLRLPRSKRT